MLFPDSLTNWATSTLWPCFWWSQSPTRLWHIYSPPHNTSNPSKLGEVKRRQKKKKRQSHIKSKKSVSAIYKTPQNHGTPRHKALRLPLVWVSGGMLCCCKAEWTAKAAVLTLKRGDFMKVKSWKWNRCSCPLQPCSSLQPTLQACSLLTGFPLSVTSTLSSPRLNSKRRESKA